MIKNETGIYRTLKVKREIPLSFLLRLLKIFWTRIITKPCDHCKGTGSKYVSMRPPKWSVHATGLKKKHVCGVCHGTGRIPRFKSTSKLNFGEKNNILFFVPKRAGVTYRKGKDPNEDPRDN